MAKTPPNNNKNWTPQQEQQLKKLIQQNTPTRVMGLKLGRTPSAVQNHANQVGLSTKPTNQKPYNRRKK
jgi:hypothetical protein